MTPDSEKKPEQNDDTSDLSETEIADNNASAEQDATQQIIPQALSDEERQAQEAMQQWLRQVPEDQSRFLKEKYNHQHRQRRLEYQQGEWQPPENGAMERW